MRRRRHLLLPATAIATISVIAACSGEGQAGDDSIKSAHVELAVFKADGSLAGRCSGVLISPTRVLTAGHCVVDKARWKATSPGLGKAATGSKAYAYDFANTVKSQPRLHDIAIVMLDEPLMLKEYPQVAAKGGETASGVRMRRVDGDFEAVSTSFTSARSLGFANDYTMKMQPGEELDTGGALMSSDGRTVVGIMHGKGGTSGNLYATRTDAVANWIKERAQCTNRMGAITTQVACYKSGAGVCLEHGPDCPNSKRDAGAARGDAANYPSGSGGGTTPGTGTGTPGTGTGSGTGTGETGSGSGSGGSGSGGASGSGSGSGAPGTGSGGGAGGSGSGSGGGLSAPVGGACDTGNFNLTGRCYGNCQYLPGGSGYPGTNPGDGTGAGGGYPIGSGGASGSGSGSGSPGTGTGGGTGAGGTGSGSGSSDGTGGASGSGSGFGSPGTGTGTGGGTGSGTGSGTGGASGSGSGFGSPGTGTGGGFGSGTGSSGSGFGASGSGFGSPGTGTSGGFGFGGGSSGGGFGFGGGDLGSGSPGTGTFGGAGGDGTGSGSGSGAGAAGSGSGTTGTVGSGGSGAAGSGSGSGAGATGSGSGSAGLPLGSGAGSAGVGTGGCTGVAGCIDEIIVHPFCFCDTTQIGGASASGTPVIK